MVARARVTDVYLGHRFVLCALAGDESMDEWFGATVVFSDVFDGDIWVGALHRPDEDMLAASFVEASMVDVWMVSPEGRARCVTAKFDEVFSLPLDLDARSMEPAWEWVKLKGTSVVRMRDVPREEYPPELIRLFDRRD